MRKVVLLLVCLWVPLLLGGCLGTGALAAISAASGVLGLAHNLYQVGGDIVAATAVSCRKLPAAEASERSRVAAGRLAPSAMATPYARGLCDNLRPDNPALDAGSPAWVATIAAEAKRP